MTLEQTNEPTAQGMTIFGHVDGKRPGLVTGWVVNQQDSRSRCTVVAYHEGRVISEAKADLFREDLQSQGIGDGRYAFQLQIPPRLSGSGEVEIVEKLTGTKLIGSPIQIGASKVAKETSEAPLLLVDLSDMIFYLEHHDHLSGIQRVQANVLSAMVEEALVPMNRIRIVYFKDAEQTFYEMPLEFITALIEDTRKEAAYRQFKRNQDGRLNLEALAGVKPLVLDEQDAANAVILMLGAAWVFPSYFQALRQLKRRGVKFVPLLHDLIPVVMPTMCDKGTAEVFKIFLRRTIRNADFIVTVSEHTRRDLISYCESNGLTCPPTAVTKNGQSLGTLSVKREPPPVQGDYVLFVSTIEGRKNHRFALRIWERLKAEHGDATPTLVFVGRLGWRVEGLVEELHEKNFLDQKIVILSEVSDGTLASLYEHCLFTIYPSLYEGWGLPVGESLAFGKPCLASRASSLPEAGGELAIYFDPASLDDAVSKASRLIFDVGWRQELEAKIATGFKPITWSEVASNIVAGITECAKDASTFAPPVLEVGEYNFSRVTYLESNIVHGEEVARHLRDFSEPLLTYRRLSLEHYIQAEECLADGTWYYPENWGRWGHWDGNAIAFRVPNPEKSYLAIVNIHIPAPFLPANVQLSCLGRVIDTRRITTPTALLRIETQHFRVGDDVRIHFKLKGAARDHIDGDPRRLGLGLARLAVIEADSVEQRLEVLERTAFL